MQEREKIYDGGKNFKLICYYCCCCVAITNDDEKTNERME